MIELNTIYNEDCIDTIEKIKQDNKKVDIILTSPPYNTGRLSNSERSRNNREGRYDIHIDNMTQDEYCNWCCKLFNEFDNILSENGVILWNVSYGNDATVNKQSIGLMWLMLADIIRNTNFSIADRIAWKKSSALPNNTSKNKLTRIVEDIYVFVRKDEYKTFNCNKGVKSVSSKGQKFYENIFNFIEAKNNDGSCPLNKATYSSELCEKLLSIYANTDSIIYDPFMGTGTTAIACENYGCKYLGSELSENQCEWATNRLIQNKLNK